MIHPEAKFFSSFEPMTPDKLSASRIQWSDMYRVDFSKGRNWKEEEGIRSQIIPKPHQVNNIRSRGLRIILLGSILCFPDPMGWSHLCRYDRCGGGGHSPKIMRGPTLQAPDGCCLAYWIRSNKPPTLETEEAAPVISESPLWASFFLSLEEQHMCAAT